MNRKLLYSFVSAYFSLWLSFILSDMWKWKTEITIQIKGSWIVMFSLLVIVGFVNYLGKEK